MKKLISSLLMLFVYVNSFSQGTNTPCSSGSPVATVLTVNASCSYSGGTTVGSTYASNAANGGTPSCASPGAGDVWFSFVAPASGNVTIDLTAGTMTDSGISLYSGTCGAFTEIICDDDGGAGAMSQITQSGLTPGTTYFIRVWEYFSGTGTFNICVFDAGAGPTPPVNDACGSPTTLPCGTTNLAGTTVNSVNETHGTGCTMSGYGVWYTFVGDGQSTTISSTATFDHEMAIASGNCGSLTNIACQDGSGSGGTESYTFTTTNGVNYYVYIAHYLSSSTTTGTFTISRTCVPAPTPPANDACGSATTLPCGTTNLAGTTVNAVIETHGTGCTMSQYGVWYTFVGDGQSTTISSTGTGGFDHEMAIASGSCGSLSNIACRDLNGSNGTETYTFTTTLGVTYFVYIGYFGSGTTTGTFTISRTCVPAPTPPVNDACGAPTALPCGTTNLAGTTVNSVPETVATCTMSQYGVWYSFTGNGQISTITLNPSYDMEMAIYSGSCGSLTNIACVDNAFGIETYTFTTTNGINYLVYVGSYLSSSSTTGTFTMSHSCSAPPTPPSNDDPCAATPLTVGASCSYTATTNLNATATTGAPAPGCANYNGGDVWFTAVVPASGNLVINTNTGVVTDGGMAIYSGTCGSLTLLACDDDASPNGAMPMIQQTGLTPGSTIWIRFWEYGNNNNGTFSICVYDPGAGGGAGSTCGNPVVIGALPYNSAGQTTCGFGDDYSSANACGSSYMNGDDFVYSYTPSTNQSIDVVLTNTGTWTGVFITQGCPNAGGATCVASNTQSGGNPSVGCVALTAGVTYYIIVSTFPSPQCTPFDISITASTSSAPTCNLNYAIGSIAATTTAGAGWTNLTFSDDRFADSYTNLGFSFCFDNVFYTQALVSSNGYIIFPGCYTVVPGGTAQPTGYSPWPINAAVPNTTNAPRNSIMLTWQDIDPSVTGTIRYKTTGTAPNRVFTLQFNNVAMFSSSCNSSKFNGEMRLYETTNNIEFAIVEKTICNSWNAGAAILGLHNFNGTIARVPAGHNYPTQWSETNTGYSFTPSCACPNPLSIDMIDISAERINGVNEIKWSTNFNNEISSFVIERSEHGVVFSEVSTVISNQNFNGNYVYYDEIDDQSTWYYRIKIVDLFGNIQYSKIVVLGKKATIEILNIWPIPFSDLMTISLFSPIEENITYEISDMTGRGLLVNSQKLQTGENIFQMNTSMLSNGIYKLVIKNRIGQIINQRSIVKQ